ncbi:MAG: hypothetical protein JSV51_01050 [Candidatus Bathyarchaeota archaeon]|nr:MAG: hypothetical protein JSV51_01050 [Candidatus Bathyarchaeota archaeon]
MRSDYALYIVAIICFIVAVYTTTLSIETPLYISALAVLGIIFIGLGYMSRPKKTTLTIIPASQPTPPESAPESKTETEKTAAKRTTRKRKTRRRKKKT